MDDRRQFGLSARFSNKGGSAANGLLLKCNRLFVLDLGFSFEKNSSDGMLRLVFLSVKRVKASKRTDKTLLYPSHR